MSTTKHLIITERAGSVIEVLTADDRPAIIATDGGSGRMVYFAPEEAPALALAILGAAGIAPVHSDEWAVGGVHNLARIAADLQHHIEARDKQAKEAADREALEGEAWELYKALNPTTTARSVNNLLPTVTRDYLRLARTAREIHGGTK